jgi:undecaprenyl diphosphate synthase
MVQHLAFIMDGNRRWAKKQGMLPFLGHNKGAEAIHHVIEFCLKREIKYVSLYTFSLENFKRSAKEVTYLFDLFMKEAHKKLDVFIEHGVRIRFIGDRELFPQNIAVMAAQMEERTSACTDLNLNFLFCYGARQEIIVGIKKFIAHIKEGLVGLDDLTDELFKKYLWTAGIPEPELIIRTSGIKRLSNFLLYQAAYSEFYFLDCLWPEITQEHMQTALDSYIETKRNFGH